MIKPSGRQQIVKNLSLALEEGVNQFIQGKGFTPFLGRAYESLSSFSKEYGDSIFPEDVERIMQDKWPEITKELTQADILHFFMTDWCRENNLAQFFLNPLSMSFSKQFILAINRQYGTIFNCLNERFFTHDSEKITSVNKMLSLGRWGQDGAPKSAYFLRMVGIVTGAISIDEYAEQAQKVLDAKISTHASKNHDAIDSKPFYVHGLMSIFSQIDDQIFNPAVMGLFTEKENVDALALGRYVRTLLLSRTGDHQEKDSLEEGLLAVLKSKSSNTIHNYLAAIEGAFWDGIRTEDGSLVLSTRRQILQYFSTELLPYLVQSFSDDPDTRSSLFAYLDAGESRIVTYLESIIEIDTYRAHVFISELMLLCKIDPHDLHDMLKDTRLQPDAAEIVSKLLKSSIEEEIGAETPRQHPQNKNKGVLRNNFIL